MTEPYFTTSFYPLLLRFLPLKTGYLATLPIYHFAPGQSSLLAAHIIGVNETDWIAPTGEKIPCYAVDVIDDISPKARTTYYISKQDRTRLQSDMAMGDLRIQVERR